MIWYRRAIFVFSGMLRPDRRSRCSSSRLSTAAASSGSSSARCSSRSGSAASSWSASVARKVRGFERVLDAPALFAVAYDEIGSSIYFALGIVAAQALGLTPLVLLATGLLFLVVSLSYAEGTAAIPETGGAATFTRRAYNDLVGFTTGWVLFLDYLIVIALSTLFLPHYLAASLSAPSLTESPWDVMIAVARDRPHRRRPARPPDADPHRPRSSSQASTSPCRCSSSSPGWHASSRPGCSSTGSISRPARAGTTSSSRCRSRCSPTPGSRPSPTSPRRRASRAACCRARSSPRSASS